MVFMIIGLILALILFISAYFSKRRFGILTLALTAGYTLSLVWSYEADLIAGALGFGSGLAVKTVAPLILMLIPVIIVLVNGYSYKSRIFRLIGSLAFAGLFIAFIIKPLSQVIPESLLTSSSCQLLIKNSSLIIGFGIVAALIDLLLAKPTVIKKKR